VSVASRSAALRRDVGRFRRMGWQDRVLLAEALGCLAVARTAISTVGFRRSATALRLRASKPNDVVAPGPTDPMAPRVGWAVRSVASRTPWPSSCLVQSLAGHLMLRRRGVSSTFYFGVAIDEAEAMQAHSWLRSGSHMVTGGAGHLTFSAIAAYERPGDRPARSPSVAAPSV
jgi:hypothetical protein